MKRADSIIIPVVYLNKILYKLSFHYKSDEHTFSARWSVIQKIERVLLKVSSHLDLDIKNKTWIE